MQQMDHNTNANTGTHAHAKRRGPLWLMLIVLGIIVAISGRALAAPLSQATSTPEAGGQTTTDGPVRIEVMVVEPTTGTVGTAPSDAEVATTDSENGGAIPIQILIVVVTPDTATSAVEETTPEQTETPEATPAQEATPVATAEEYSAEDETSEQEATPGATPMDEAAEEYSAEEEVSEQEATPEATPMDEAADEAEATPSPTPTATTTERAEAEDDQEISMDRPELQASEGHRGPFGFGSEATQEEIAEWDIDVMPDGTGLPEGEGSVSAGAELYATECARCHGEDGRDETYEAVVNPYDPDSDWPQTPRTIGNYWPYATTIYDYIQRSMPYDNPGSLEPDEVYAITAWLLHQNEIIEEDAVMNAETLPAVEMPAHDHFIPHDPRTNYRFR